MNYSIKHLFHIDAEPSAIFTALTSVEGLSNWWTVQVEGSCKNGDVLNFDFGDFEGPRMKTIVLEANKNLTWECQENKQGWTGNHISFLLDENEGKTRIRFEHNGFQEQDDFYAACNFSWGRYLESLRQYCQTGTGKAFGSKEY